MAIIIASLLFPDNEWGKRISKAYALRFLELGGNITDEVTYDKNDKKINVLIRNILKIEDSIKRKSKIENILNKKCNISLTYLTLLIVYLL